MSLPQEEVNHLFEHFVAAYPPKYQAFFEIQLDTISVKDDGAVHFRADEKMGGFAGSQSTGNSKHFVAHKSDGRYTFAEHHH